ncbi:MAG TPA: hypothetical protein VF690_06820, partial [Hymenobacter sp.]
MSTQPYEIEHVAIDGDDGFMLALISMLTGLPMEELRERLDARYYRRMGFWGRDFTQAFRLLGYDCSPRFKKFDPETPVPCLLRFAPTKRQMVIEGIKRPWWSVVVYCNGQVYAPYCPG